MPTLATIFRAILTDLQKVIAPIANSDRARTAFLVRIYYHLSRTIRRFETLVTRWHTNTLPKPGKPRPGRPSHPRATPPFPTGYAWLIRSGYPSSIASSPPRCSAQSSISSGA